MHYLVFQCGLLALVQMSVLEASSNTEYIATTTRAISYILISLEPSSLTRVLFPTISAGYTKSDKMPSWTAVSVRLLHNDCDIIKMNITETFLAFVALAVSAAHAVSSWAWVVFFSEQ